MKIYLAGPMSHIPKFNFPAFESAADALRVAGHEVVSPHELDDPVTRKAAWASPDGKPDPSKVNGQTWGDFLARDIKLVVDEADAVAFLSGWGASRGARLEAYAALLSGKKLFCYYPWSRELAPMRACDVMEILSEEFRN